LIETSTSSSREGDCDCDCDCDVVDCNPLEKFVDETDKLGEDSVRVVEIELADFSSFGDDFYTNFDQSVFSTIRNFN
jgi:hypothetical protein